MREQMQSGFARRLARSEQAQQALLSEYAPRLPQRDSCKPGTQGTGIGHRAKRKLAEREDESVLYHVVGVGTREHA